MNIYIDPQRMYFWTAMLPKMSPTTIFELFHLVLRLHQLFISPTMAAVINLHTKHLLRIEHICYLQWSLLHPPSTSVDKCILKFEYHIQGLEVLFLDQPCFLPAKKLHWAVFYLPFRKSLYAIQYIILHFNHCKCWITCSQKSISFGEDWFFSIPNWLHSL